MGLGKCTSSIIFCYNWLIYWLIDTGPFKPRRHSSDPPLFSAFFTQPAKCSSSSAPPPHAEVPYRGHPHWPPPPPPPYYYLPYSYPAIAPPPPLITTAASLSAPKQTLNHTATASSQSTQPDEPKYPLLSDFFSTLFARHPEWPALRLFQNYFNNTTFLICKKFYTLTRLASEMTSKCLLVMLNLFWGGLRQRRSVSTDWGGSKRNLTFCSYTYCYI